MKGKALEEKFLEKIKESTSIEDNELLALGEKFIASAPTIAKGWFLWGKAWMVGGCSFPTISEEECFKEALKGFEKASSLCSSHEKESSWIKELWCNWGRCWYLIGNESGEPADLYQAVEKFRLVKSWDGPVISFLSRYGDALADLGWLTGHADYISEAIEAYEKVVQALSSLILIEDSLLHSLAIAYRNRYYLLGRPSDFEVACHYFQQAVEQDCNAPAIWFSWANLYLFEAKKQCDPSLFNLAIEKFGKEESSFSNDPFFLCQWAEALIFLGMYTETLEPIKEGEAKIIKSLAICPTNTAAWAIYGKALYALGDYFEEASFYLQAIDKFNEGIKISSKEAPLFCSSNLSPSYISVRFAVGEVSTSLYLLYYGMAQTHYAIGDLQDNSEMLEKATHYFLQLSQLSSHLPSQIYNDWGVALMRLCHLAHDRNLITAAIEKFELAIANSSEEMSADSPNLEWFYNYACALDFLGNFEEEATHYEKAIQLLEQIVAIDSDYVHARFNLALALHHLGEFTSDVGYFYAAAENFERLAAIDSEDEFTWNEWGVTLMTFAELVEDPVHPEFAKQLYEQAENKLLHALALGNMQALYHLACLHCLCGNHAAAMHYIEKAERNRALPPFEQLYNDEWLASLRTTSAFRHFIQQLSSKHGNDH